MPRSFQTIVNDMTVTNYEKALECLNQGDSESAQVFALLAIADTLTDSSGTGLSDVARSILR